MAGGPKDLGFIPDKNFYIIGDVIKCQADARPSPSFNLFDVNTGEYFPNTDTVNVTDSMYGRTHKGWICQAENTVLGETYNKSAALYKDIYVVGGSVTTWGSCLITLSISLSLFLNIFQDCIQPFDHEMLS